VARAALLGAGAESGTLDVTFVNDGLMRQLHGHWLGANRTTDVLSFDLRAGPGAAGVEGEVVVCLPAARRAARSRGGDWKAEGLLYVAHGCLHLCGYDDRAAKGAARMHRREDDLLESLGWGRVFSGADGRTVPGRRRGEARR
jgi:probable rRNA maturation factor